MAPDDNTATTNNDIVILNDTDINSRFAFENKIVSLRLIKCKMYPTAAGAAAAAAVLARRFSPESRISRRKFPAGKLLDSPRRGAPLSVEQASRRFQRESRNQRRDPPSGGSDVDEKLNLLRRYATPPSRGRVPRSLSLSLSLFLSPCSSLLSDTFSLRI